MSFPMDPAKPDSGFFPTTLAASGLYSDREILARKLGISPTQLSYVTQSAEGEGLLFYGNVILPFQDHFPKNTKLYAIMTTKPNEKLELMERNAKNG